MRSNKRTPSNRALHRRSRGIYPVGIHVFIKSVVFSMHLLLNQSMKDSCISKMTAYYQIFEGSGQYFKIYTHVCIYIYIHTVCIYVLPTTYHIHLHPLGDKAKDNINIKGKHDTWVYSSILDVFSQPSKTQYHWRVATQWMILKLLKSI